MKRALFLSSGFIAVLAFVACGGGSSVDGGSPGSAGPGGSSGSAGTSGASSGHAGSSAAGSAGKATGGGGSAAGEGGKAGASGSTAGASGAGQSGAAGSGGTKAGSGGSTGGTGGSTGGSGGSAGAPEVEYCSSSPECATNQVNKLCNTSTGKCVGCLPANDTCPKNQYCSPQAQQCVAGCKLDSDCGAPTSKCDVAKHACVACLGDGDCAPGTICSTGACVVGCDPVTKPCSNGNTCCQAGCHDTTTDLSNCGGCGQACPVPPNSTATCASGKCGMGACAPGFSDCNGDPSDGCEVNTQLQGACVCQPGSAKSCYDGPAGTQGKGICKFGTQTCAPTGMGYLPGCVGQLLPEPEVCGDGKDHDCNGVANDVPDVDGDGWTACQGDCCEDTTQCATPKEVNPGAFDTLGDAVDNDCNGKVDDSPVCTTAQKFTGVTPTDVANAIELCKFTSPNPPLPQKTWGVMSSSFLLANGAPPTPSQLSDIQNWQVAILNNYGTGGVLPRKGATMAGMSTGRMRDKGDPGYVNPNSGTTFSSSTSPPAVYLNAHGGNLVASAGCSGNCPAGSGANDSVLARFQIRTPTNAKSFSYDLRFFSSEYWTYQCTAFNDFFLALLTQGGTQIPSDRNISFDSKNNPISVNNGFFESCVKRGCNVCPDGVGALAGTGMDVNNTGGGTKWLTTQVGIVPGETVTLDYVIFDVSDHILDSLILLDNFQFLTTPSGPPSTEPAK